MAPPRDTTRYRRSTIVLWAFAIIGGSLDFITTWSGIALGLAESNPVMSALLIHLGLYGLIIAKVSVLVIGYIIYNRLALGDRWAVPVAIGLTWLSAGLYNLAIILLIL